MTSIMKTGAAMLALASVSACGLTGALDRPDPLWGEPDPGIEAAELPTNQVTDRQALPPRADGDPDAFSDDFEATDDELLGGPDG